MRNAILVVLVLGGILVGSHYLAYYLGRSNQRLATATTATKAVAEVATAQRNAVMAVDSADDCMVDRMLCRAARGGCDESRICNPHDNVRDNGDLLSHEGNKTADSAK